MRDERTRRGGAVVAGLVAMCATAVRGQCEPDFLPVTDDFNNGAVHALTEHNGALYAGGSFTATASSANVNRVARWDGSNWHPLGAGLGPGILPDTTRPVGALCSFAGGLIAGGSFGSAGGSAIQRIARWDGTAWHPLGTGVNGPVNALHVYDGHLIAGGKFTTAGGAPANLIARWNGTTWSALHTGMSGGVAELRAIEALTVYNGELVASGYFDFAGGVPASSVARWNGQNWQNLGTGITFARGGIGLRALCVHDGWLIAGGNASQIVGVSVNRVARWNGTVWEPLGSGLGSHVYAAASYAGDLYVGGAFITAGGNQAFYFARWDGTQWGAASTGTTDDVRALTHHNGKLIVGGDFLGAGALSSRRWARWGCDSCYPDCNASGSLTVADFGCFQSKYVLGDPYADCNASGTLTVADYGCFQGKYVLGCP
ncbi:MAG: hypothetical protein ACKVU4_03830 [Phycisphaerales bacterium]